jgi:type II secretory pathway pseudopilin PulG
MNAANKSGFTLIEVMLFLAISGLLVASLLTGAGVNINRQRYKDSVDSLESTFQTQYSDLSNVQNLREGNTTCGSTTVAVPRGQTDCVIYGKYLEIDGTSLYTTNVIGTDSVDTSSNSIVQIFKNASLFLDTNTAESDSLQWGTKIAWASSGTDANNTAFNRSISAMFLRSPVDGTFYTFVDNNSDKNNLNNVLSIQNYSNSHVICVDPNGLPVTDIMAIVIDSYASNSSSVTVRSNDTAGGSKC